MRIQLKLAIVKAGLRNTEVARHANQCLPPVEQLTELHISQLITQRRKPSVRQAAEIAKVLGVQASEIFDSTKEPRT